MFRKITFVYIFHDGGSYHIETRPLICRENQWAGDWYLHHERVNWLSHLH